MVRGSRGALYECRHQTCLSTQHMYCENCKLTKRLKQSEMLTKLQSPTLDWPRLQSSNPDVFEELGVQYDSAYLNSYVVN